MSGVAALDVLGDANRRAIVHLLGDGDRSVQELADVLPISRPAVSRHLRLLKEAGLVESKKRAHISITPKGRQVLQTGPERIDLKFLKSVLEQSPAAETSRSELDDSSETPDVIFQKAHDRITEALASEMLDRLRDSAPAFFEDVIVQLLLAMGYGHDTEAGRVIGSCTAASRAF